MKSSQQHHFSAFSAIFPNLGSVCLSTKWLFLSIFCLDFVLGVSVPGPVGLVPLPHGLGGGFTLVIYTWSGRNKIEASTWKPSSNLIRMYVYRTLLIHPLHNYIMHYTITA